MSSIEIISKVEALQEWTALEAEAHAQVESLKKAIQEEMQARDVEELEAGTHIIRWTTVLSNRFDSTGFKKALPELYKQFTKQSTSKRFSIS